MTEAAGPEFFHTELEGLPEDPGLENPVFDEDEPRPDGRSDASDPWHGLNDFDEAETTAPSGVTPAP